MFETFFSNDSHTALISTPFLCTQKKIGNMKKVFEKIVEGILACSGFVTSLTIVLIVLFLFSEAVGLFNSRVIEEGYVLALNKDNKVNELTPVQIKDLFDEEITNWREVGGENLLSGFFVWRMLHSTIRKNSWERLMRMQELALRIWWNVRRASWLLCRNSSLSAPTPFICCRTIPFR